MSRGTAFAKIAAMAQFLDDMGLHDDATVMDELLEAAADPGLRKEAGLWENILARLSGFARKVLFKEYRQMYNAAKASQEKADTRLEELQAINKELKEKLSRHMLPDWREGIATLLPAVGMAEDETLGPYDELHAKMTARLLKLAPKAKKEEGPKEPAVPPLMPEEKEEGKEATRSLETAIEEALAPKEPAGTPEEPIPLTTVKRRPEPAPAPTPEAPPAPPPPAPPPAAAAEPLPGWRKERFGSSGKHGWEWEWEVSPEGNKLRLPKTQLDAASSGKGKILHRQGEKYRPTGGTSSRKLRTLMGDTYWQREDDPSNPGMAILVRTEETVLPPLSTRPEPTGQAEKLKELGKSSSERMGRLVALAAALGDEPTDEEKLEEAARALLAQHGEIEEV